MHLLAQGGHPISILHPNKICRVLVGKGSRRELERSRQVLAEVARIMPSGIEVILMGNVARGKDFVEGSIAGVESVVVLIAAVEIDFQSRQIGGARESERAIAVPKHRVRGAAEHAAEKSRARRIRSASKVHRQFLDQRGAVRAHRNEKLRMAES